MPPWIAIAGVALGIGCGKQHADLEVPSSPSPTAPSEAMAPSADLPPAAAAPAEAPDCSRQRVRAAIDGTQPWTDEGPQCLASADEACNAGHGEACHAAALLLHAGAGGVTIDHAQAGVRYREACRLDVADACHELGVLVRDGAMEEHADAAARTWEAHALLSRGCQLGVDDACAAAEPLRPPADPPPLVEVAGANVNSTAVDADGLHLQQVRCAVGRPLLGLLAVTGALSKRASALDKCAPKGQAFVAYFEFAGGKTTKVRIRGGTERQNRCVAKAVAATKATMPARCGAVILAGDRAGAQASVAALSQSSESAQP